MRSSSLALALGALTGVLLFAARPANAQEPVRWQSAEGSCADYSTDFRLGIMAAGYGGITSEDLDGADTTCSITTFWGIPGGDLRNVDFLAISASPNSSGAVQATACARDPFSTAYTCGQTTSTGDVDASFEWVPISDVSAWTGASSNGYIPYLALKLDANTSVYDIIVETTQ